MEKLRGRIVPHSRHTWRRPWNFTDLQIIDFQPFGGRSPFSPRQRRGHGVELAEAKIHPSNDSCW
jgi:hypothetical protein